MSRLTFPSLGDLPNPGIEPRFPALQTDSLPLEPSGKYISISLKTNNTQNPQRHQKKEDKFRGIKLLLAFSLDTVQVRRHWNEVFSIMKE